MNDIKAIQTQYKGYRFRSRLEARWAVFFDALDIKWGYEHEGYDLGKLGWYLPDFWLPQVSMWAEVKAGKFSQEELDKCDALTEKTCFYCLLLDGTPEATNYYTTELYEECDVDDDSTRDSRRVDRLMGDSRMYHLSENRFYANTGCIWPNRESFIEHEELTRAVKAARSARFEHGENAKTTL
jgi:hypothetical protein